MTKEEIIEQHQGIIIKLARAYLHRNVEFLDLVQAGNLGLLEAFERFEPIKEVKFVTYAFFWVHKMIQEAARNSGSIVTIPTHIHRLQKKVNEARAQYETYWGDSPDYSEISVMTELTEAEIRKADFLVYIKYLEQDNDFSFGGRTYISCHESPCSHIDEEKICFQRLLETLPGREKTVLKLRSQDKTLEEIGSILGYTRERIRQLEEVALEKLQRLVKTERRK